ncbi:MAG: chemotaxis protein CheW [Myxococcota bacterium]|nr:chemotaxis protein CheW [Myxococcota bacterium]
MEKSQEFCAFLLNKLLFGVPIDDVQEVLRYQTVTFVPCAPRAIRGLINLRGRITTAIDLRSRLDMPPFPDDHPMNVVVRSSDGEVVSLLVDQIDDIIRVPDEFFEKAPDTLSRSARELVLGAYKLDKRLLLTLDTERVINIK